MKTSKKSSRTKASAKPARVVAKAKKPKAEKLVASKAKVVKRAKGSVAKAPRAAAATPVSTKATRAPAKPVHEWAEAIKKAALQNKQGHNAWPGAGSPPWKGKQRPE